MSLDDDFERLAAVFNWKITNFSYCLQKKEEALRSPTFFANTPEKDVWYISIYPRGRAQYDNVGIFLTKEKSTKSELGLCILSPRNPVCNEVKTGIDFEISVLDNCARSVLPFKTRDFSFKDGCGCGLGNFLKWKTCRFEQESLTTDDTLVVCCRIWSKKSTPEFVKYFAQTHIVVEKKCFTFSAKEINGLKTDQCIYKEVNVLSIENFRLSLKKVFFGEDHAIQIAFGSFSRDGFGGGPVFRNTFRSTKRNLLACRLELIDAGEKIIHSIEDEKWKEISSSDEWSFPPLVTKAALTTKADLFVRCQIVVSYGDDYKRIESASIELKYLRQPTGDVSRSLSRTEKRPKLTNISPVLSNTLEKDMRNLYKSKKLSDFVLRAGRVAFPVHKSVLSIRSPVFRAMFDNNMQESQTGEVTITDLDSNTVDRMLLFVYTDTVRLRDWDSASKLYFAADKYGLQTLKNACSSFLNSNISISNACETLVLADLHNDEVLKLAAKIFISSKDKDVLASEEWKRFEMEHVHLAMETMRHVLLSKQGS